MEKKVTDGNKYESILKMIAEREGYIIKSYVPKNAPEVKSTADVKVKAQIYDIIKVNKRQWNTEYTLKLYTVPVKIKAKVKTITNIFDGTVIKIPEGDIGDIDRYLKDVQERRENYSIERMMATNEELINCDNLVRIFTSSDIEIVVDGVRQTYFYCIMETLAPVERSIEFQNEREVLKIGCDMCSGCEVLHNCKDLEEKGIVHRDLKIENTLYAEIDGIRIYKLIDFDVSTYKGSVSTVGGRVGTRYTVAPELAEGEYSKYVDLYSIAATLYALINRDGDGEKDHAWARVEFRKMSGDSNIPIVRNKKKMIPPKYGSKRLKELLVKMLGYKRSERPYKTAKKFREALQKIQISNAKECYQRKEFKDCKEYVLDIFNLGIRNREALQFIKSQNRDLGKKIEDAKNSKKILNKVEDISIDLLHDIFGRVTLTNKKRLKVFVLVCFFLMGVFYSINKDTVNNLLFTKMGTYYYFNENYDKAEKYLSKTLERENRDNLFLLGTIYYERGEYEDACNKFYHAYRISGGRKDSEVTKWLGSAWHERGKVQENKSMKRTCWQAARRYLRQAVEANENDGETWRWLGYTEYDLGNYNKSIKALKQAIKINEKDWDAWKLLGCAEYRLGHYNKAIKYLKQAVELNEKDWNAWSWLGMSYFETERHDDAYKCIKRSADHKDSNGLYWMGVLYQEGIGVKKDKIKAIDYFLKAKTAGNEYVDGKLEQMEN